MVGAVRRVGAVLLVLMVCSAAWAGKLTVRVTDGGASVGGATVQVQPAGLTGTTNPAGKWAENVPAGAQRVICYKETGGVLKGGIADITMPAGNHDITVPIVDAFWIQRYFPHAVGNAWQYRYTRTKADGTVEHKTRRERCDRAVVVDGESAVVLVTSEDGSPAWEETRACNANGLALYDQGSGAGSSKYVPPLRCGPLMPAGYEWVSHATMHHADGSPDTPMAFRCKFEAYQDVTVPAGVFPNCARVRVTFEGGGEMNRIIVWMARNIGIVREMEQTPDSRNEKLLEEYSIRGLIRPIRPIGPLVPAPRL